MIFTSLQLNSLLETIKNLHWSFVAENLGTKFIPKSVLKVLSKYGIKESKVLSMPEQTFNFGMLAMALGDKRANELDIYSLKKFIKSGKWLPLTDYEQEALNLIENRLLEGINVSAQKIGSDVKHLFTEKQKKKILYDKFKEAIIERQSANELISNLARATDNWNYDFGRMVDYVMHECFINPYIKIYTNEGWKNIKDIQVGDEVLTHKGRFKKVTKLLRRKFDKNKDKIYNIVVKLKSGKEIKLSGVTGNHPFKSEKDWTKAKNIKIREKLKFLYSGCEYCNKDISVYFSSNGYYEPKVCDYKCNLGKSKKDKKFNRIWHNSVYRFKNCSVISIRRKKTIRKNPILYNFSVEEDESYVANGLLVHNCLDTGKAYAILRSEGKDGVVYKRVHLGACEICMKIYTYRDRKTGQIRPRLFKLGDLIKNGTNIGKKQIDWKPVIGSTHPNCRCDLEFVPKESKWSDKKKVFETKLSDIAKRLDLSKFIKITITND